MRELRGEGEERTSLEATVLRLLCTITGTGGSAGRLLRISSRSRVLGEFSSFIALSFHKSAILLEQNKNSKTTLFGFLACAQYLSICLINSLSIIVVFVPFPSSLLLLLPGILFSSLGVQCASNSNW